MEKKKRSFSISLYALTIGSIVLATLAAVTICIAIFATVYSQSLIRDAKLSAEQATRQTNIAISANLDNMKDRLTSVLSFIPESRDAEDFADKVTALTKMQSDIFSVTVYDDDGNIVTCAGSG